MEGNSKTIELNEGLDCSLHIEFVEYENEYDDDPSISDTFDIKYSVFPVLQRHIVTDEKAVGDDWILGLHSGDV